MILVPVLPNIGSERAGTAALSVRRMVFWYRFLVCLRFVLISLDKLCVPCSSERIEWLLQMDGLFKASQVADSEEWNGIYDAWWELTRGDHRFAQTLGRIPATSKLRRPDLLPRPVTSWRSHPRPIDGELSNATRSLSALRLLNYAAHLRLTPDHSRADPPNCARLVRDGPFFFFFN